MCLLVTKVSFKSLTNERPLEYLSPMVPFLSPNIPMLVNKSFLIHTRLDKKLLISNEVSKLNPGLFTVYRSLRLVCCHTACIIQSCHTSVSWCTPAQMYPYKKYHVVVCRICISERKIHVM